MTTPSPMRTVSLTFVRVGATRVAVPSARVERVHSASDVEESEVHAQRIELRTFLGLEAGTGEDVEVLLSISGVSGTIVATMPLVVTDVTNDAVHPVPGYLASWAASRGIAGVVLVDGELSFLLDADVFDRRDDAHLLTGTGA